MFHVKENISHICIFTTSSHDTVKEKESVKKDINPDRDQRQGERERDWKNEMDSLMGTKYVNFTGFRVRAVGKLTLQAFHSLPWQQQKKRSPQYNFQNVLVFICIISELDS